AGGRAGGGAAVTGGGGTAEAAGCARVLGRLLRQRAVAVVVEEVLAQAHRGEERGLSGVDVGIGVVAVVRLDRVADGDVASGRSGVGAAGHGLGRVGVAVAVGVRVPVEEGARSGGAGRAAAHAHR